MTRYDSLQNLDAETELRSEMRSPMGRFYEGLTLKLRSDHIQNRQNLSRIALIGITVAHEFNLTTIIILLLSKRYMMRV